MFSEDALNPFREKFPENNRVRSGDVWGQGGTRCILGNAIPPSKARLDETDLERGLTPHDRNCRCLLNLFSVRESDHRQNNVQCGQQHLQNNSEDFFFFFFNETYKELKEQESNRKRQKDNKLSLRPLVS